MGCGDETPLDGSADSQPTNETDSCIPGMSRRDFFNRILKKAVIAGTLSATLTAVEFYDHRNVAKASS